MSCMETLTRSLDRSNCFTTTMSAKRRTRVTALSSVLAARTIVILSSCGSFRAAGNACISLDVISQSRSIVAPVCDLSDKFSMRTQINQLWLHVGTIYGILPAALASLQASYMSCLISGLSSAIVSPTVTNRSTAKFTACPTRLMARNVRSVAIECGRSDLCCTRFDIYGRGKKRTNDY